MTYVVSTEPEKIPWIGSLSAEWKLVRLKWTTNQIKNGIWGDEPQGSDDDIICVRVADFNRTAFRVNLEKPTLRNIPCSHRFGRLLKSGDLLIEKSGGGELQPVGTVVIYDQPNSAVCSNFIARIEIHKEYSARFLTYLHAHLYAGRVNLRSINQTTGIQNLDSQSYFDEFVGIPPLKIQESIAHFLDRKTAAIDTLIAKKQRLIQLLEEKRAALINQAVTKGLNTNAPMKNSEIPWIREIPEHWRIRRIKHLLNKIIDTEHKTATFYPDGEYLVVRTSNVRQGHLILKGAKYTDLDGFIEWTRRGKPQPGDILFTREAPPGEACIVPNNLPLCLGQRMVLFRVKHDLLNGEFGVYSLYADLANEFIQSLSQGSTVAHFNISDIGNIPILTPPIEEQRSVVNYLKKRTLRISVLLEKTIDSIEKLQEYRRSLITAAVTGKLEVREEDSA